MLLLIVLAQTTQKTPTPEETAAAIGQGVIWIGIAAFGAGLIAWVAYLVFKRMGREDDEAPPELGFTLSSLRELHRRGELSDEEFDRAKAKMLDASRRSMGLDDGRDDAPPPDA